MVGSEVNRGIVDVLAKEYDLDRAAFRDIAPQDARQVLQSKAVSALLVVAPLTVADLGAGEGVRRAAGR